jgi:hypothetical protein
MSLAQSWSLPPHVRVQYTKGQPIIPRSGSFSFDSRGAFQPFGRPCQLGPIDRFAPVGMHSCKISEPNVWTALPNNVPCAVGINAHYHSFYINDIYDTRTLFLNELN